jgi:hypothetical protein
MVENIIGTPKNFRLNREYERGNKGNRVGGHAMYNKRCIGSIRLQAIRYYSYKVLGTKKGSSNFQQMIILMLSHTILLQIVNTGYFMDNAFVKLEAKTQRFILWHCHNAEHEFKVKIKF